MAENKRYVRLGAYFGMAATAAFVLFTLIAVYLYPGPFSPLESTVSHLGNPSANPDGHLVFDAGCMVGGVLFLPFVASLAFLRTASKWQSRLAAAAVVPGIVASVGLALIGLYPETVREVHVPAAMLTFLCLTAMLLLVNLALWGEPKYPGWLAFIGALAIVSNFAQIGLVLTGSFPTIVEWLSAYLPQAWVLLFCWHTLTEA
ncbi:DUF998 domain-containing protein [Methanocella arvoryzae]|uniref:DUF998 domain-containing protein n=1 Tax=Methanocella arvoryzae (strain DSM 22066 / NBRC 105507 / MRE50) TaxID=351160 RepID=Q0W5U1_METAR|nr:DUF998 domain-containing protein [Methanocella arvoryzae]CAJ36252.1 hypothetical protein RCIX903 [Methanocella arvoryzae MRE50]